VDPSTFCERGLLFLIHAQKADSKKIVYDLFVGEFSSILRLRIATPADRYISFEKPYRDGHDVAGCRWCSLRLDADGSGQRQRRGQREYLKFKRHDLDSSPGKRLGFGLGT
jgi:hypothetical protein